MTDKTPLVSCVMPTRGRRELALRAVESFLSQTYPVKELVILDDHDDPSFPYGIDEPFIFYHVYHANDGHLNIPQKRNRVNGLAQGLMIAHFDSDDWSAPERLDDQVRRLQESGKAVTGYHTMLFHEPETGAWGRYFGWKNEPLGTSLCYLKSWWANHRFCEVLPIGEDNDFGTRANQEHDMISVEDRGLMVALAHPGNTSPKDMGNCRPISNDQIPIHFPR